MLRRQGRIQKHLSMKAFVIILFALSLSGCATKEKAETGSRELLHTSYIQNAGMESVTVMQDSTRQSCVAETESGMDSIVQRLCERIVTDSCGRIVMREKVLSQERYKGTGRKKASCSGTHSAQSSAIANIQTAACRDTQSKSDARHHVKSSSGHSMRGLLLYAALSAIVVIVIILRKKVK